MRPRHWVEVVTHRSDGRCVIVRTACDPADGASTFMELRRMFSDGRNDYGEPVSLAYSADDEQAPEPGVWLI